MSNLLIIDLGGVRGLYGRCNIANSTLRRTLMVDKLKLSTYKEQ
jgi:hypothetical protein